MINYTYMIFISIKTVYLGIRILNIINNTSH